MLVEDSKILKLTICFNEISGLLLIDITEGLDKQTN